MHENDVRNCILPLRKPKDFSIDDVAIHHQHQPLDRAHKLVAALTPTHALWNRQSRERRLHDTGQQRLQALARRARPVVQPAPLFSFAPFERIDLDTTGARKTTSCLRRITLRIESGSERRATFFDLAVGLL